MGTTQEVFNGMGGTKGIAGAAVAIGAAIGGVKASCVRVEPGERGVRVRKKEADGTIEENQDRAYKILRPGIHFLIPGIHVVKKVSVQQRTDALPNIKVMFDDRQHDVESSLRWSVMRDKGSPYKALFSVESGEELKNTVISTCASGLGRVLRGMQVEEIVDNQKEVLNNLQGTCEEVGSEFGVSINSINILLPYLTHAEMMRQAIRESGGHATGRLVSLDLTNEREVS